MSTTSPPSRRRAIAREVVVESPEPLAAAWGYLSSSVINCSYDSNALVEITLGLQEGLLEVGYAGRRPGRHARND